jgi:hypothetical protein
VALFTDCVEIDIPGVLNIKQIRIFVPSIFIITCTPSEDRALLAGRFERLHQNVHVLGLRFVARLMNKRH